MPATISASSSLLARVLRDRSHRRVLSGASCGAIWPWKVVNRLGRKARRDAFACARPARRTLATGMGTGGVMIELHWRRSPWTPALRSSWIDLPRDLAPGESKQFEVTLRRPLGASMLVVEPHLQGVSGFNALGGPKWVRFL